MPKKQVRTLGRREEPEQDKSSTPQRQRRQKGCLAVPHGAKSRAHTIPMPSCVAASLGKLGRLCATTHTWMASVHVWSWLTPLGAVPRPFFFQHEAGLPSTLDSPAKLIMCHRHAVGVGRDGTPTFCSL
ncbi:hypothetical protein IF2G_07176 [Cordyceps javanica]|nr:hypothetical protein IF2G_07176 [Cordyceps javanica]